MLSIARSKNIPHVTFCKGNAASLPFNNASFGLVVAITMLEFADDIQKVVNEIYRILKPGGLLILGCLNLNSQPGKTRDSDETFRNAHFFTKKELKELLQFFGDINISESVYLTPSFEILDGTMENYPVEGAFLAIKVQKNKR